MFIITSNKSKNFSLKIINANRYVSSFIIFSKAKYRISSVSDLSFLNHFHPNSMANTISDAGSLHGGFKSTQDFLSTFGAYFVKHVPREAHTGQSS